MDCSNIGELTEVDYLESLFSSVVFSFTTSTHASNCNEDSSRIEKNIYICVDIQYENTAKTELFQKTDKPFQLDVQIVEVKLNQSLYRLNA